MWIRKKGQLAPISADYTSCTTLSSFIHPSHHVYMCYVMIVWSISKRRGTVTPQYVLSTYWCHFTRFAPDSDFFSPHTLYSAHSTHCLFTVTSVVNTHINYSHTATLSLADQHSGPSFQRSMTNKVLAGGYVTRICEIYLDDLLIYCRTYDELLDNLRKILVRLRFVRSGDRIRVL